MADKRQAQLVLSVQSQGAKQAARDVAAISKEAEGLKADLSAATNEAKQLASALDDYEARRSQLGAGVEVAGDVASSTGGLRGALDALSGGNAGVAGQLLEAAEAFGDIGEFAPKAVLQLKTLSASFADTVSSSSKLGASLIGTLTPALGTAGAGVAAFAAAALPVAAILGVAALAIKSYTDAAAKQAKEFEQLIDAQRSLDDRIAEGLTTEDAQREAESIERRKQLELERLEDLENAYKEFERDAGAAGPLAKAFDAREEALVEQIKKSKDAISGYEAEQTALNKAVSNGKTIAGESTDSTQTATQSEKALADARQSTDTATKAAQDAEKEAQKARDDAQREAEQQAEKAANAQKQYNEAVQDAATSYREAVQDINTGYKQALADNAKSFYRDTVDIATKYRRDEYNDTLKFNRSERDALIKHEDNLDDIREDAAKSRADALRDGDFRAAFEAREAGAKAIQDSEKNAQRERRDRAQAYADQRADLLRNAQQARSDRMLALTRQNEDAKTAQSRELQQANIARQRQLQAAATAYNAELAQLNGYLQQRLQMEQAYYQQSLNMTGAGAAGGANTLRGPQAQAFSFGGLKRVIQR